ncbi:hypothetical protein DFH06DRAFT_1300504, partial [Mycena polygramma]
QQPTNNLLSLLSRFAHFCSRTDGENLRKTPQVPAVPAVPAVVLALGANLALPRCTDGFLLRVSRKRRLLANAATCTKRPHGRPAAASTSFLTPASPFPSLHLPDRSAAALVCLTEDGRYRRCHGLPARGHQVQGRHRREPVSHPRQVHGQLRRLRRLHQTASSSSLADTSPSASAAAGAAPAVSSFTVDVSPSTSTTAVAAPAVSSSAAASSASGSTTKSESKVPCTSTTNRTRHALGARPACFASCGVWVGGWIRGLHPHRFCREGGWSWYCISS